MTSSWSERVAATLTLHYEVFLSVSVLPLQSVSGVRV